MADDDFPSYGERARSIYRQVSAEHQAALDAKLRRKLASLGPPFLPGRDLPPWAQDPDIHIHQRGPPPPDAALLGPTSIGTRHSWLSASGALNRMVTIPYGL
jgi:hypothetical protein